MEDFPATFVLIVEYYISSAGSRATHLSFCHLCHTLTTRKSRPPWKFANLTFQVTCSKFPFLFCRALIFFLPFCNNIFLSSYGLAFGDSLEDPFVEVLETSPSPSFRFSPHPQRVLLTCADRPVSALGF